MMLKHLAKLASIGLLVTALFGAVKPALAAGTLPIAMAQQIDVNGQPLANCQVNFYVAGTVATKQNVYSDFGLSQQLGNPLACDQTGRIPMFWLADGLIHVQLTDSSGVPIIDTTMQVLGPSSGGGGGGGTVDPTTILATGDIKARYGTGTLSGFVRLNGLTIGNAISGATERANADTQSLFVYLCTNDPNLVMTPPRSGNCLNDYNANKQIAVADWRGRAMVALDDMGNVAAGRLTVAGYGAAGTTLGLAGGAETQTLTLAQLPTGISSSPTSPWAVTSNITVPGANGNVSGLSGALSAGGHVFPETSSGSWGNATLTATGAALSTNTGGGAHPNVQPSMLATFYMKL